MLKSIVRKGSAPRGSRGRVLVWQTAIKCGLSYFLLIVIGGSQVQQAYPGLTVQGSTIPGTSSPLATSSGGLTGAIQSLEQEATKMKRSEQAERRFDDLIGRADSELSMICLVRLRLPYQAEGDLELRKDPVIIEAQREVIARVRKGLLAHLQKTPSAFAPDSIKEFKYIPFVGIRVNLTGLEALRSSELALDIQEDSVSFPSLSTSTSLTGADKAWENGLTGKGQTIAILDSGVDKTHPFLAEKVVAEACFSTNNPNLGTTSLCPEGQSRLVGPNSAQPCEVSYTGCDHGTHVAGIAAGSARQISGVAKGAHLISVQVFSLLESEYGCGEGESPCLVSFASDQLAGMEFVFEQRLKQRIAAVNLSLGSGKYEKDCDDVEPAYKIAIDLLRSVNIATIAAAGNGGEVAGLAAPACISTAISVGATRGSTLETAQVASFSSSSSTLKLLAPGDSINSSVTGDAFALSSGTSMAAPHVAGAWAIAREKSETSSVDSILEALTSTGKSVSDPRNGITRPLINIGKAVAVLGGLAVASAPNAPTNLIASSVSPNQINLRWQDNSSDEEGFVVFRMEVGRQSNFVGAQVVSANITQFKNYELREDTTYQFYVAAYNVRGYSVNTNVVTVATLKVPIKPPVALSAKSDDPNRVAINWTPNSTTHVGFRVMRRQSTSGTWGKVSEVDARSAAVDPRSPLALNLYVDNTVKSNTEYVYYLTAFNNGFESERSVEVKVCTPDPSNLTSQPPSPPNNLKVHATPVKLRPKMADISWDQSPSNEAGYRVYRMTNVTLPPGVTNEEELITTLAPNTNGLTNVGLVPGVNYTYRVVAFNSIGELSSSTVSMTAPMYNFIDIPITGTQPTCAPHTASGSIQKLFGCSPNTIVRGDLIYYRVKVGDRGRKLSISLNGRNSLHGEDVDLYVRRDVQPTTSMPIDEYEVITDCATGCKSATKGVNESIEITNAEVGDWHILVSGHAFIKSTYTLTVTLK